MFFVGISKVSPLYPPEFCSTEEFGEYSIPRQIIGVVLATICGRMKYYTGFFLAQASVDACGLSFNGFDEYERPRYDRIQGINIRLELADNPKSVMDDWNKCVQQWLKRYVYQRVVTEKELRANPRLAERSALVTFMVSALWHGFYPEYFIGFFIIFLHMQTARFIYRAGWKFRRYSDQSLYVIRYILNHIVFNYFGCGFMILDWKKSVSFYKNTWYIGAAVIAVYLFFRITQWGQRKPPNLKKDIVIIKDETEEYIEQKLREKMEREKKLF